MSTEKKYCYRYHDGNDNEGRPIVTIWKRLIIRETDKTFWHVEDFPHMSFEQVVSYWTGGRKEDQNATSNVVQKALIARSTTTRKKRH